MGLLHELRTVAKCHPDPITRELLARAHSALYHLTLEMQKQDDTEDSVQITETPSIPTVGPATEEDRL